MASELKIRWDGDVPGIAEKRLSLDAFARPLELLLAALRRIATQMVSTAIEGEQPKSGRFANVARWIDIELVDVAKQSTGTDAYVVFHNPPEELNLWGDIPSRATVELLDAIELESGGHVRNSAVRNYLRSLPPKLHHQVYEYTNGQATRRVELGDVSLTDLPPDPAVLKRFDGNVVGVQFEPARPEVRIKTDTMTTSLGATPEIVERALDLRHDKVKTISVHIGSRTRVISLKRASDPDFKFGPEAVEEYIFKRWDTLLGRLAK
jgi:hypothetical protein